MRGRGREERRKERREGRREEGRKRERERESQGGRRGGTEGGRSKIPTLSIIIGSMAWAKLYSISSSSFPNFLHDKSPGYKEH